MALAGKELRKVVGELFGPNTATGVIKYVDAAIIAGCMLTFFFQIVGAKLPRCIAQHLDRCLWPSLPDRYVFSITSAHPNLLRVVPASYRDGEDV